MPSEDLPPLREVITQYGLRADKSLGQHFLTDMNLTRKIARAAGDLSNVTVIEVGPGPGGLSRALLETGCEKLILIEKDERFLPALEDLHDHFQTPLEIIRADALAIDESTLIRNATSVQIISNLPYNVGSPLLVKWLCLDPWPPWYQTMTVMLQKEVVDRLVAEPNSKVYGRLSVLAQWRADVLKLFDVPATAFVPPPKVQSAIVQITPRAVAAHPQTSDVLQKVTQAAFGQRRKMIRSSLKSVLENSGTGQTVEKQLINLSLDPSVRAENLAVDDYVRLADNLARVNN